MAVKNKKKSDQRNPVTMKTIKWSLTRELTRTRTLISLADRALALERNTQNITVLDGYLAQLLDRLALIEGLQENAMDLLKSNKKLCTQSVFEANRAEITKHLEARGHQGLVNQIANRISELTTAVSNARSGNVSNPGTPPSDGLVPGNAPALDGIAPNQEHSEHHNPEQSVQTTIDQSDQSHQRGESTTKPCESSHSSDVSAHPPSNILNRGSSEASQDIAEFADDLAVRIGAIEHTQTLLLDSSATANRAIKNLQDNMQAMQDNMQTMQDNMQVMLHDGMQNMQEMMFELVNRKPMWQTKPEKNQEEAGSETMNKATKPSIGRTETPILQQSWALEQENSSPPPPSPVLTPSNDTVESLIRSLRTHQNPTGSQEKSSPLITNAVYTAMTTIPVFDGKPGEYSMFMQLFNTMVHENDEIPVKLKHALLMKLLSGEPKSMLQSVSLSEEDYHALRDSLERQYNRDKDTKQNLIHQLNKFSFSEDSYEDMEKDLNKYCSTAYSLRSKGCSLNDSFFLNSFIAKLPQQIMGIVFKKHHEQDRTFQELVGITFNAIAEKRALESAETEKKLKTRSTEFYSLQTSDDQTKKKHGERPKRTAKYQCFFCDSKEHTALNCKLSIAMKLKAIEEKKLCSNCLRSNHSSERCNSKFCCFHCRERHHTGICQNENKSKNSKFFRGKEDGTSDQ